MEGFRALEHAAQAARINLKTACWVGSDLKNFMAKAVVMCKSTCGCPCELLINAQTIPFVEFCPLLDILLFLSKFFDMQHLSHDLALLCISLGNSASND